MYQIIYAKYVEKDLKHVDKTVIKEFKEKHIQAIADDPYGVAKWLKGILRIFWVYHFTVKGVSYRVAYQIFQDKLLIVLIAFGARENFYKELEKRTR